jgi:hypothetical protein
MGLFQPNILSKKRSPSIEEISLLLPKFEKFISYLVSNVFPTTNSWQIRAVVCFSCIDVQRDNEKRVWISEKITHFDNSDNDLCDNVITWCNNVIKRISMVQWVCSRLCS